MLQQRAVLAFWLVVQTQAYDSRAEKSREVQGHAIFHRLRQASCRIFDAVMNSRSRSELWCAFQAWHVLLVTSLERCAVEVAKGKLAKTRGRSLTLNLRIVMWGCRKIELHHAFATWVQHICVTPTNKKELERSLIANCERLRARQTALIRDVGEWLLRCDSEKLVSFVWLVWQQTWSDARRYRVEGQLSTQNALRQLRLDYAHSLLIVSASRVQTGFIIRACFAIWRRLRPEQKLRQGDEQLSVLQSAHVRICSDRAVQIESLAARIHLADSCSYALLAWVLWKRHRLEGDLITQLETLQIFLGQYFEQSRRQEEFQTATVWLESMPVAAAFVDGGNASSSSNVGVAVDCFGASALKPQAATLSTASAQPPLVLGGGWPQQTAPLTRAATVWPHLVPPLPEGVPVVQGNVLPQWRPQASSEIRMAAT